MTDYKDLIEQLRERAMWHQDYGVTLREILASAAAAIEALIAERDVSEQTSDLNGQALEETQAELAALKQKIASTEPVPTLSAD